MKLPFLKLYVRDWRADPAIRACSPAARGLWVDLCTYMHEAEPMGHLIIGEERLGLNDAAKIAMYCTIPDVGLVAALLNELNQRRVLSIAADGTILSRYLVRQGEASDRARENGRKGGNPTLLPSFHDDRYLQPPASPSRLVTREESPPARALTDSIVEATEASGVNPRLKLAGATLETRDQSLDLPGERDAQARAENFGTHQKPDAAAPALVASRPVGSRAPEAAVARVGVALGGAEPGGAYPAFPTAEWPHGRFFGDVAGGGPVDAPAVADPTRSPVPAIAFARWFVEAGSAIGAIRCVDQNLQIRRESLETAAALLTAHGRDECEARAHRLFAAHLNTDRQRIIRPPTIAALEAWWDSAQLRPEQRGNSDRPTPRPRSLRPIAGGRPPLRYVEVETPSGPMMIWKRVGAA